MKWLFRIFFAFVLLCAILAAGYLLRNLLSKEHKSKALVKQRSKKVFPVTMGSIRRDKSECKITFFIPELKKELVFDVSETLYDRLPTGTVGTLTWRGSWLRNFSPESYPKGKSNPPAEPKKITIEDAWEQMPN